MVSWQMLREMGRGLQSWKLFNVPDGWPGRSDISQPAKYLDEQSSVKKCPLRYNHRYELIRRIFRCTYLGF